MKTTGIVIRATVPFLPNIDEAGELLITAEMRPYENPWPYNVKTVFNKYLGNGRSN